MYQSLSKYERFHHDFPTAENLLRHRGDQYSFARRYAKIARQAVARGQRAIRELAPHILDIVSEPKNLKNAWDHRATRGGGAPGIDGKRFADYCDVEAWSYCRALSEAIRAGTYRPQSEKIVKIAKASGNGVRELRIPCIGDRVVERGVVQILQPLLDPSFDSRSFGFRPRRSMQHALATAELLAQARGRWVWVAHDLKDAFSSVPLQRLLEIIAKRFGDPKLTEFLAACLTSAQGPGLRQGGSLSPLMLNLFLDHFVDRVWRRKFPAIPLIRYADDVLLLCANLAEARRAEAELRQLTRSAGMQLKAAPEEAIRDLRGGQTTIWLGMRMYRAEKRLAMKLADGLWRRLREQLALAHDKADSQLVAEQVVRGWLYAYGPGYQAPDADRQCLRIVRSARRQGFEEVSGRDQLAKHWQLSHARWRHLRNRVRLQMAKQK